MRKRVFASERVVLPTGVNAAQVQVTGERITSVEPLGAAVPSGFEVIDLRDLVLLPGIVDTHVHVNEPGRTNWEGFASATRAAAAGGVTTILDMPLNAIPPTTAGWALREKRAAAERQCHVDVGFIGGIVPDNAADLPELYAGGVLAWKCFLVDSGVAEFPAVDEAHLRRVMPQLAEWHLPLMVHAELPGPIAAARPSGIVRRYSDYAATRPVRAEVEAVELMIALSAEFGANVHIVHVSSAEAVDTIGAARARGAAITAETCPHYLTFAAEEISDGATEFKCAPPIRTATHREALWQALAFGTLDIVVSDHSPAPALLKRPESGDLATSWGGIASLQLGLSATWSGAERRGVSLQQLAQWMTSGPAQLVRLTHKGRIAKGCDADLVVWDPAAEWMVDAAQLRHRHPVTPYHGLTLAGRVCATYLRGELIYDRGAFPVAPRGRLLDREHA
ncbi:MAG: allantoinase AllB [Gemmatimonadaceae bacterium]